jgi:hypothetical protein
MNIDASLIQILPNAVVVRYSERPDVAQDFLTFDVPEGWEDVRKVCKKVLVYEGRNFTFRGWNSDRNECFFSAPCGGSASVAKIV